MFHNIPPDRARIELHNADNERRMRQRDVRGLGRQFLLLCGVCVVGLAVLYAAIQLT